MTFTLWLLLAAVLVWLVAKLTMLAVRSAQARRSGPSYWERRLGEPRTATVTRRFEAAEDPDWAYGTVQVDGALWTARCPRDAAETYVNGQRVRVAPGDGLVLTVVASAENDPP